MTLFDDFCPAPPSPGAPKAIELCHGAGAMGLGIQRAGFGVEGLTGLEVNPQAVATARLNGHHVLEADVHEVTWAEHAGGVTLVAGGVPCQPFSRMGLGLGDLDKRDCFPAAVRAVAELRPEVVILENVAGLAFKKHAPYVQLIVDCITDLGYTVETRVIDCADYGTPQHRKRFIILAVRHGHPLVWAEPAFGPDRLMPHRTVAQAFGWPDDDPRRHANAGVMEAIQAETRKPMRAGVKVTWHGIVLDHQPWMWERPATTIAGRLLLTSPGTNANDVNGALKGKNDGVRLTVPQMARLQGFPLDYQFVGNQGQVVKQIANAFPPQPAEALARAATRHLLGQMAATPAEGILL